MLLIDERLLESIGDHARVVYPRECCGALLGTAQDGTRAVEDVLALENRRDGGEATRRYLIDADDYRRVESEARARGLEIVGFYHSHPDHAPEPSEFDREHAFPWYAYVIVPVTRGEPGEATCWKLSEDRLRFHSQPIEVLRRRLGSGPGSQPPPIYER